MSKRVILDRILAALGEPHRRCVVDLLSAGPRTAGELAVEAGLAPPAMSRHLRVLKEARLIEEAPSGPDARVRLYRLRPQPMIHMRDWLDERQHDWQAQVDAMGVNPRS